jgi:DsbC/DsbD-like thiol-disulfide interchange protein
MLAGFAFALTAAGPALLAQKSEEVVRWSARAPAVKPGGAAAVELKAEIDAGWHLYALTQVDGGPPPLAIEIAKGQTFTLDKDRISGPLPAVIKGTGSEPDSFHYDDKVTLIVTVKAPKTAKAGKHTVPLEVTYQVCSGSICLRPTTAVVPVELTVRR